MPRPDRLLRLLQLLSHRRCVPLSSIKRECNMPRRTVFRYLRALSEANIPVYYDPECAGYRLAGASGVQLDTLSHQETTLLVMCLSIAQANVNKAYAADIASLASRILTRQPFGYEQLPPLPGSENVSDRRYCSTASTTDAVTFAIVQAANTAGKDLLVRLEQRDSESHDEVIIRSPGLRFEKEWVLFSRHISCNVNVPLKDVLSVQICQ